MSKTAGKNQDQGGMKVLSDNLSREEIIEKYTKLNRVESYTGNAMEFSPIPCPPYMELTLLPDTFSSHGI